MLDTALFQVKVGKHECLQRTSKVPKVLAQLKLTADFREGQLTQAKLRYISQLAGSVPALDQHLESV